MAALLHWQNYQRLADSQPIAAHESLQRMKQSVDDAVAWLARRA